MNRKTKGALAAGAGAILLLGGAGSLALWSDEDQVSGGDITAGDFGIDCGTTGTWTDQSGDVPVVTINPASDLMVPGDTWVYTGDCAVTATGKNMKAEMTVTGIGSGSTNPATPWVTITTTVDGQPATSAPVEVTGGTTVPVTVSVVFSSATPDTEFTNGTINVSGMTLQLNQVRP
ncbi:alternate-type signal peptide domain-containing protein [Gordonia iterans]